VRQPYRIVLLSLVALLVALPAGAGKKKAKKPGRVPPEAALQSTLNEKRDDIQRCAIEHALAQGASRVEVTTRVTVNNRGQVLDCRVTVSVTGGDGEQVRSCVDKVIRAIHFPRFDAPLLHIERNWTIAAQ
jgi:hypothetical protein